MNRKISLLPVFTFLIFLNVSCSKDDDVKVAPVGGMIATVDNVSWTSSQPVAIIYDGNISITGIGADGSEIVITVKGATKGKFTISGTLMSVPDNLLSFTPANASIDNPTYSSTYLEEASVGEVVISEIDETKKTISGTFTSKIMRMTPEEKTIIVKSGSFNEVAYTTGQGGNPDNTFSATVDGSSFTVTTVSGVESFGSILLNFAKTGKAMAITVSATTNTGTFAFGSSGDDYYATFVDNATMYQSTSGSITISSHDKTNDRIEGTFSFNGSQFPSGEGTVTVTNGSFAVSY
jgi:hypothetical protein